jgi:hypothetical protein
MQLCSWQLLLFEINYSWKITFECLTFEIQNFQTTSDGEMTKKEVVDLKKSCNFVVDNFFIWNHLSHEFLTFEIWFFSNDLGWRNSKNESYRSQKLNNFVVDNFFI